MCLYMSACIYICKIEYRWIDVFIYIDASHTHTHSILSQNKAYLHFALSFQTRTWGGCLFIPTPRGPSTAYTNKGVPFLIGVPSWEGATPRPRISHTLATSVLLGTLQCNCYSPHVAD